MWNKVKSLIRRSKSFLITTHVFPDGDAVGSQLALAQALRKMGKRVLVVNEHPVPKIYRFVDPRGTTKAYAEKLRPRIKKCDVAFIVDAGSPERVGRVGQALRSARVPTVCIDHHKTNSRFADFNVVDSSASSTLEYDLPTSENRVRLRDELVGDRTVKGEPVLSQFERPVSVSLLNPFYMINKLAIAAAKSRSELSLCEVPVPDGLAARYKSMFIPVKGVNLRLNRGRST